MSVIVIVFKKGCQKEKRLKLKEILIVVQEVRGLVKLSEQSNMTCG